MNAYQIFKNEIDDVYEEIDTLLFILDGKMNRKETVGSAIERHIDIVDRLKNALESLKKEEGETRIEDIQYEGQFRN